MDSIELSKLDDEDELILFVDEVVVVGVVVIVIELESDSIDDDDIDVLDNTILKKKIQKKNSKKC